MHFWQVILVVRPAFGGANAGVEEQRFGRFSRGEQIVGADNIFNVLLNSGIIISMDVKRHKNLYEDLLGQLLFE